MWALAKGEFLRIQRAQTSERRWPTGLFIAGAERIFVAESGASGRNCWGEEMGSKVTSNWVMFGIYHQAKVHIWVRFSSNVFNRWPDFFFCTLRWEVGTLLPPTPHSSHKCVIGDRISHERLRYQKNYFVKFITKQSKILKTIKVLVLYWHTLLKLLLYLFQQLFTITCRTPLKKIPFFKLLKKYSRQNMMAAK